MEEKLRQDFPIDWDEDHYVSRKEFFKFMTLASGGLALGSVGLAVWTKLPRDHRRMEEKEISNVGDLDLNQSAQANSANSLAVLQKPPFWRTNHARLR